MASSSMLLCCFVFGTLSIAIGSSSGLRLQGGSHKDRADVGKETQRRTLLAQTPEAEQQLVICNAYTSPKSLEITKVRTRQSLTEDHPLAYKQCKEFNLALEEGDQLDFKAGGLDVGTFYATGLPRSAASLLLIPHRRSPHAVGLSFESHAFAELQSPQLAVIDAYRSKSRKRAVVKIMENMPAAEKNDPAAGQAQVEEELKFNSVVAVNAGNYLISLAGTGDNATTVALNAAGAAKYVIMCLGNEGEVAGGHYPQELVVFPNRVGRTATCLSVFLVTLVAAFHGLCGTI